MSRPGPGWRRSLWDEGPRLGAPPRPDAASCPVDVTAACSPWAPAAVVSQETLARLWQVRSLPVCPAVSHSDCGQDTLSAPVNPQCPPVAPGLHNRPSGSRTACPFPVVCHPCPARHTLPFSRSFWSISVWATLCPAAPEGQPLSQWAALFPPGALGLLPGPLLPSFLVQRGRPGGWGGGRSEPLAR